MSEQVSFTLRGRNPDVLTCIANLSNDEVFTPPELAGRILDMLAEAWAADHGGADLWADKTVRLLDPFTKSGVFLLEITSRLTEGLAQQMPDLKERVNHILTQQVFGIGITRLTSLLARRSVYCSKYANGAHSIATSFGSDAGNISFEPTEHTWADGKCTFCGDSQAAMVINKSEKVKDIKTKAKDGELTDKEKKELSAEEKEYKSKRKLVQKKLIKFATRIPAFMYLTDFRENTLQDVITKLEPDLFLTVTGLTVQDFHLLVRLKVFNTEQMNQAVFAFRRYEDASLRYTGIESHDGLTHYGLYDTVVAKD